jgi:hypothetical protein
MAPPAKKRSASAAARPPSSKKSKRKSKDADKDYRDSDTDLEEDSSTITTSKKPISAAEKKRRKANSTKQQPLAFRKTSKYSVGMKLLLDDSIYGRPSDIPEEVAGHLFEYQVVCLDDSQMCTVKYNDLVIKPGGDKFRSFEESDEVQRMAFPLEDLDDAHELWQKATGRCNSRAHEALEAIRKTQKADVVEGARAELDDIDELFRKKGRGPHMLELEFDRVTELPVDYPQKGPGGRSTGVILQKWEWLHRLTPIKKNNPVTRYVNKSGKTFDTGKLSKYLMSIDEKKYPIAYQRAQHVLQLNGSRLSDVAIDDGEHSRELLVMQQVSSWLCFLFLFSIFLTHCFNLVDDNTTGKVGHVRH